MFSNTDLSFLLYGSVQLFINSSYITVSTALGSGMKTNRLGKDYNLDETITFVNDREALGFG